MAKKYFDIPVYTYHRAVRMNGQTHRDIPLVLIHAFPVDHRVWDHTAYALTEKLEALVGKNIVDSNDTTILAIDMPGAGTNPIPDDRYVGQIDDDGAYSEAMDRMASSIVHAIEQLGYDQAIIAGISMGGYAALSLVRQFPQFVAGLALCDTKADADNSTQRAKRLLASHTALTQSTLEPVVHFAQPKESDSSFKKSPEFIDTFTQWINTQTPAGIAWRQRMAAGRRDENSTLAHITVPVAIVSGTHDDSSDPSVMRPMAEKISNANVRFTEIQDCGHFSCFEKPQEVASALYQLIRDVHKYNDQETEKLGHLPSCPKDNSHQTGNAKTSTTNYEDIEQNITDTYMALSSQQLSVSTKTVVSDSLASALSRLTSDSALTNVVFTDPRIDLCVEERQRFHAASEKERIQAWKEFLSENSVRVIMIDDNCVALSRNAIQTLMNTGIQRHVATYEGSYIASVISQYPQALYFLGRVHDDTIDSGVFYIALNLSACDFNFTDNNLFFKRARSNFDWEKCDIVCNQLNSVQARLVAMSLMLAHWHSSLVVCSHCGSTTHNGDGGWTVYCDKTVEDKHQGNKQHIFFPRIEPAVIVRICDENDRILLQHNYQWDNNMYSVCAGFVEAGENIEQAIQREAREELGISVKDVHYLGSQPWPYPHSLMMAYSARICSDSHLHIDNSEVADAQWFTRDEFMDSLVMGKIQLPPRSSIALKMIEQWYGASLR